MRDVSGYVERKVKAIYDVGRDSIGFMGVFVYMVALTHDV